MFLLFIPSVGADGVEMLASYHKQGYPFHSIDYHDGLLVGGGGVSECNMGTPWFAMPIM